MNNLLDHPWMKVLVIATTIAMCSFALRETASITQPIVSALGEVLVPVAVAFALAYVVTPVVDGLGRLGLNRTVAAGLLFGCGSLLLIGALVLIVPAVVRQSVDLSVQMFRGETYADRNNNGRFDSGENFIDTNLNLVRDQPLLSRFASFLEESQSRFRVSVGLGLDEQSLAFLSLYAHDTQALRTWLEHMVAAASQGRAVDEWPVMPVEVNAALVEAQVETPAAAPAAGPVAAQPWSPTWPGPLAKQLDEALPYLAEKDRAVWQQRMSAGGQVLFHRHAQWLSALHRAKGGTGSEEPQVQQILIAWKSHLSTEERKAVSSYALTLERLAKEGQTAARDVLTSAGVNADGPVGGETLTDAVAKIEDSLKGSVDDLPTRIGGWAKAGVDRYGSVFSLALGVLLVPIYSFFLLLGMPKIRNFIKDYLPIKQKAQIIRITRDIEKVVAAFFRGRLLICVICALVGSAGFFVIGLFGVHVPYGMLWGIGLGLATAIPLAGLLFIIPAVALTMIQPNAGVHELLSVLAVYGVVQGLEACLIPLIMGREVELHPVMLIVALLLCGKLLGVLGLILAVPIAASFRILLREYFWPRVKSWASSGSWKSRDGA